MPKLRVHWRQVSGAVVALVIAFLAFGPAVDALICQDDLAIVAEASHHHDALAVADHDHDHQDEHHGEDGGLCIHGHGHSGTPYLASAPVVVAAVAASAEHWSMRGEGPPVSDRKFGLMRPPRA